MVGNGIDNFYKLSAKFIKQVTSFAICIHLLNFDIFSPVFVKLIATAQLIEKLVTHLLF